MEPKTELKIIIITRLMEKPHATAELIRAIFNAVSYSSFEISLNSSMIIDSEISKATNTTQTNIWNIKLSM